MKIIASTGGGGYIVEMNSKELKLLRPDKECSLSVGKCWNINKRFEDSDNVVRVLETTREAVEMLAANSESLLRRWDSLMESEKPKQQKLAEKVSNESDQTKPA